MIKVLLADPHPITRYGIKSHLYNSQKKFTIVDEISHGKELLPSLKLNNPCVVLLELKMPGISGFQVLKNITKNFPKTKVIVFSSFPHELYAHHCINSGACGYIHKTAEIENFSKKILSFIEDEVSYPKNASFTTIKDGTKKSVYRLLSARETEVLKYLLDGKRNKDIALKLNINEKTVSTYKTRLLNKLSVKNIPELILHINSLTN